MVDITKKIKDGLSDKRVQFGLLASIVSTGVAAKAFLGEDDHLKKISFDAGDRILKEMNFNIHVINGAPDPTNVGQTLKDTAKAKYGINSDEFAVISAAAAKIDPNKPFDSSKFSDDLTDAAKQKIQENKGKAYAQEESPEIKAFKDAYAKLNTQTSMVSAIVHVLDADSLKKVASEYSSGLEEGSEAKNLIKRVLVDGSAQEAINLAKSAVDKNFDNKKLTFEERDAVLALINLETGNLIKAVPYDKLEKLAEVPLKDGNLDVSALVQKGKEISSEAYAQEESPEIKAFKDAYLGLDAPVGLKAIQNKISVVAYVLDAKTYEKAVDLVITKGGVSDDSKEVWEGYKKGEGIGGSSEKVVDLLQAASDKDPKSWTELERKASMMVAYNIETKYLVEAIEAVHPEIAKKLGALIIENNGIIDVEEIKLYGKQLVNEANQVASVDYVQQLRDNKTIDALKALNDNGFIDSAKVNEKFGNNNGLADLLNGNSTEAAQAVAKTISEGKIQPSDVVKPEYADKFANVAFGQVTGKITEIKQAEAEAARAAAEAAKQQQNEGGAPIKATTDNGQSKDGGDNSKVIAEPLTLTDVQFQQIKDIKNAIDSGKLTDRIIGDNLYAYAFNSGYKGATDFRHGINNILDGNPDSSNAQKVINFVQKGGLDREGFKLALAAPAGTVELSGSGTVVNVPEQKDSNLVLTLAGILGGTAAVTGAVVGYKKGWFGGKKDGGDERPSHADAEKDRRTGGGSPGVSK